MNDRYALTDHDYAGLRRSTITPEIAHRADLYRVDDSEGAAIVGRVPKHGTSYSGMVFPYPSLTGEVRAERLRRDHGDMIQKADGTIKEEGKYLSAPGAGNKLYFPIFDRAEYVAALNDLSIPIIFPEGEKKALALMRIADENRVDGKLLFVPTGLSGVQSFTGAIGKTNDANGNRVPVKGLISDICNLPLNGRKIIVFFDSNVLTNDKVRSARQRFAYALRDELGAQVYFAEMPPDAEEKGLNGPDDLAYARGDAAVMECIAAAYPAFKPQQPKRETYEQKVSRGSKTRKVLAEALAKANQSEASDIAKQSVGTKVWKQLAALFAQAANLGAEERDLLFTLHAMAEGKDEFSFYYRDLYHLLYHTDGSELKDGKLTSTASQRIRRRFQRLAKAEIQCGIQFVVLKPGDRDEEGKTKPSHVRLFAGGYIEEIECLVATDPKPARSEHATFERAIKNFVRHRTGKAFQHTSPRPYSTFRQIKDGWQRIGGNLRANIERMRAENYYDDAICDQLIEVIPADLLPVLRTRLTPNGELQEAENLSPSCTPSWVSKVTPRHPLESEGYDPIFDKNASLVSSSEGLKTHTSNAGVNALLQEEVIIIP